jgi:hypothetical protein
MSDQSVTVIILSTGKTTCQRRKAPLRSFGNFPAHLPDDTLKIFSPFSTLPIM